MLLQRETCNKSLWNLNVQSKPRHCSHQVLIREVTLDLHLSSQHNKSALSIYCSVYRLISFPASRRTAACWLSGAANQQREEKTGGDERKRKDRCSWFCRFQAQLFSSGSMPRPDLIALWNGYKLDSLSPNHQSQTLNVFPFSPNICYQTSKTVDK